MIDGLDRPISKVHLFQSSGSFVQVDPRLVLVTHDWVMGTSRPE